jgi:hypothetical protein
MPPTLANGKITYVEVPAAECDDVASAIDAVLANGGELVQPIGADAPEITARVRDPVSNVIGLYEEPDDAS